MASTSKRKDNKGRILKTGESQRKDGTYMYRYTDKFQARQCIYAKSLGELRNKEKELVARNFLNLEKISTHLTVLDLVDKHCKLSVGRRWSTKHSYDLLRNFISQHAIAQIRASELKSSDLKAWLLQLHEDGYATHTVYTIGRLIKISYKEAVDDGIILRSPATFKFDFLPTPNKRDALTQEEQQAFLDFLRSRKLYEPYLDFTILLLGTGIRLCEFAGLTENDIDLHNKVLSVNHQLRGIAVDKLYIERPKTESGYRVIPMSDDVCQAVARMIDRSRKSKYSYTIDGYSNFIVRFKNGKLQAPNQLSGIYTRLSEKYTEKFGVPIKVTPHVLRHTFCTNLANSGMSIPSLQYLMGHATPTTTLDVYTHNESTQAACEFKTIHSEQQITA